MSNPTESGQVARKCTAQLPCVLVLILLVALNLSNQPGIYSAVSDSVKVADSGERKDLDTYIAYVPGITEDFVMHNLDKLGYSVSYSPESKGTSAGCPLWREAELSNSSIHEKLQLYRQELSRYNDRLKQFKGTVPDLRIHLDGSDDICQSLELDGGDLEALFPSGSLSHTRAGLVEPLLPPLRHPEFCNDRKHLMSLDYLVHDFAGLCRRLKRTSRTIFVDMGASLLFHQKDMPVVSLLENYKKFGFHFDHYYAYEITPQAPEVVHARVPLELQAAYHWINVGVSSDPASPMNPWNLLRNNYDKDDFIVVKLDIDTPSVELPLAEQLLKDEKLWDLVDVFYFEEHVGLTELAPNWGKSMSGSVKDSMQLFYDLREKGIAAHSWV